MNFLDSFALSILPAGLSVILLFLIKNKVDTILLKYDTEYKPKKNSLSLFKIFREYTACNSLEKREKRLLALTIFCIVVGYITVITWAILFMFFPDYVFGD